MKKRPQELRDAHNQTPPLFGGFLIIEGYNMREETKLRAKIKKALQAAYPSAKWVTMVASPWSEAGLSDLVGCVNGLFIALEVKLPTGNYGATPAQLAFIAQIKKSGGEACVINSVESALAFVNMVVNERT